MPFNKEHYLAKVKAWEEKEARLCIQLMDMFQDCETFPINMGCAGNSIAAGYSKCDEMLPFFARTKLYASTGKINFYSFARVRRNEEINVLKWYNRNAPHSAINSLLLDDLRAKKGRYACYGAKQEQEYKTVMNFTNLGFRDCIQLQPNILIYCGLSGTFTDIFRKGNSRDRLQIAKSFRNDFEYLKMFLRQIYMENPQLQVYVCGLPNILGIGITNGFDKYIRKAIRIVPNAVYVRGPVKNVFFAQESQKEFDYHYNKLEYMELICEIWLAILRNYIPMKFKNEVLTELARYSDEVELGDTTSKGKAEKIEEIIKKWEGNYKKWFERYQFDMLQTKREIWNYYNKNYLALFGCTDRDAARRALLGES